MVYRRPGITSRESVKPTVITITGEESTVCLLGEIAGTTPATEVKQLSGTSGQALTYAYVDEDTVVVRNTSGAICVKDTDYTLTTNGDTHITQVARIALSVPNATFSASQSTGGELAEDTYYYTVSAYNGVGETAASDEVVVNTSGGASAIVEIDWETVTDAVGYYVYRGTTTGGGIRIGSTTDLVFEDDGSATELPNTSPTIDTTCIILSGANTTITYSYEDPEVYECQTFYDYDNVRETYGEAFNSTTGTLENPLVLGAELAFKNGANIVKTVAVPTDATILNYTDAIDDKLTKETFDVLAVISDNITVHIAAKNYVNEMSNDGLERICVLGTSSTDVDTLTTEANDTLNDKRVIFVVPGAVNYYNGFTNEDIVLDSTYIACGIAGLISAVSVPTPLTNRIVNGFGMLTSAGKFTEQQKNTLATYGCLIVESKGNNLVIRHGITTNVGSLESQEISVVRETDYMLQSLRHALESNFVGGVISQTTVSSVKACCSRILDGLQLDGIIYGYKDLKVRQNTTTSTQIDVKFAFQPIYPCNYIVIEFNIDLIG